MANPQIKRFRGLNNVSDALGLGLSWLVQADNVNVLDSGSIKKRDGYVLDQAGAISSVYTTLDFTRMYLVDAGTLRTKEGAVIASGLSNTPMYWAEVNKQVFFNNGTDRGIINPDNSLLSWAWTTPGTPALSAVTGSLSAGTYRVRCTSLLADGRETGAGDFAELTLAAGQGLSISNIPQTVGGRTRVYIAPANSTVFQLAASTTGTALVWGASNDNLGQDLATADLSPLPVGCDVIQLFRGKAYAAHYLPSADQTAVWISEPLGFHLFNLHTNLFMVPGRVLMLAPTEDALIVGTQSAIYGYADGKLGELADYGVVPGKHWDTDQDEGTKRTLFWTTRGVCSALPFTNLTEHQVSVAPGVRAGGAIVRSGGQKRYLVSLQQGGAAFNSQV